MRAGAGRPGTKAKTSGLRSIDARRLHREHLLRPGLSYGWQWTNDRSERNSSIGIRTHERGLTVAYAINGEPVEQRVSLRMTPCNYGGARVWFECPHCRRRVAMLYLGWQVACRQCFQLAYPSQSDDAIDRTWRKQGKIEARLASGRRMTHVTRERQKDELERVKQVREVAFIAAARRFLGW
jgi:hypothetical protein